MKQRNNIRKMVYGALFAALCCVATLVLRFPTPIGGYIHAGDAVVLLSGFILSPVWGAFAAGLGSAMADIISGYVLYAPASFVIKALTALAAGFILRTGLIRKPLARSLVSAFLGELIVVGGYFFYDSTVLGFGLAALGDIPMNCIQAVFGIAAGSALYMALRKKL